MHQTSISNFKYKYCGIAFKGSECIQRFRADGVISRPSKQSKYLIARIADSLPYVALQLKEMSGPLPGGSRSYTTSPRPGSSSGQFPFPQYEHSHRPGSRGQHARRPSVASSITSIGGTLDSAPTLSPSIPESSNNGEMSCFCDQNID